MKSLFILKFKTALKMNLFLSLIVAVCSCAKPVEIKNDAPIEPKPPSYQLTNPQIEEKKITDERAGYLSTLQNKITHEDEIYAIYIKRGKQIERTLVGLDSNYHEILRQPFSNRVTGENGQFVRGLDNQVLFFDDVGISDLTGNLIWVNRAFGSSKVTPIFENRDNFGALVIGGKETGEGKAEYRSPKGELLREFGEVGINYRTGLHDISVLTTENNENYPMLTTQKGLDKNMVQIYDEQFNLVRKIPDVGFDTLSINWPSNGHILYREASTFYVLDIQGQEKFSIPINNLSFSIAHIDLSEVLVINNKRYLAVAVSPNSSIDASALLIFDPKGKLIWQKEYRGIVAITKNSKKHSFLIGGLDGLIEIKLNMS
jgi:hypothetical protein